MRRNFKILVAVAALVALFHAIPAAADGSVTTLLNAVTASGASATSAFAVGYNPSDQWVVQASGTYTGSSTVKIQTSIDGTTWTDAVASIATGETYQGPMCGPCLVRANVSTYEGGGKTVTVKISIAGFGQVKTQ